MRCWNRDLHRYVHTHHRGMHISALVCNAETCVHMCVDVRTRKAVFNS